MRGRTLITSAALLTAVCLACAVPPAPSPGDEKVTPAESEAVPADVRPQRSCANMSGTRGTRVTRGDLGDAWPLSVNEACLYCLPPQSAVVLVAEGEIYGLNGPGLRDHPDVDPIWEFTQEGCTEVGPSCARKNIGPLLDRGLDLCQ